MYNINKSKLETNMNNILNENEVLKYRVIVDNVILNESTTLFLAQNFIATLTNDKQERAKIIPITENGKEVLFG